LFLAHHLLSHSGATIGTRKFNTLGGPLQTSASKGRAGALVKFLAVAVYSQPKFRLALAPTAKHEQSRSQQM